MTVRDPFDRALHLVETAKSELLSAAPSPRGVPGRSLAEALLAFEEGLRGAVPLVRTMEDPSHLARCAGAIEEALRRAERLRLEAPMLDHERLLSVLADLIDPLEAFAAAQDGF